MQESGTTHRHMGARLELRVLPVAPGMMGKLCNWLLLGSLCGPGCHGLTTWWRAGSSMSPFMISFPSPGGWQSNPFHR